MDLDSRWGVPRPRIRIASDPSIRSADVLRTGRPAGHSAPQMLFETPDDRSVARDTPHCLSRESGRFSPSARDLARKAGEQLLPAETRYSITESETLYDALCVWRHPESSSTPD